MSLGEFLRQQKTGLEAMSNVGVIGLHLVSGPLVGFGIGYGLDAWLDISPWGKLVFLFIGIGAGFLNVYRDTQVLLRKMAAQESQIGGETGNVTRGEST
ncbi:MAG: AtpZ/AtpI family protein [Desulfovibrio sp.]|nr:AtpZ/AtpI family protein [Desulfovibrio sp.]